MEELAVMIVNNFATKEDLKDFATKEDLKSFATKDDLRQELKAYATKDDVRSIVKDEVEKAIGDYTDIILNSNDKMIKKLDTFLTEKTVLGGQIKEQGEEVDKLKNRVRVIEKHVGLELAPIGV